MHARDLEKPIKISYRENVLPEILNRSALLGRVG
jgi:hypothetical protein